MKKKLLFTPPKYEQRYELTNYEFVIRKFVNNSYFGGIMKINYRVNSNKKKCFIIVCCLLLVLFFSDAEAQCSMCKAVAESAQDKNNITAGLNTGILYLLAVPYLLIGGIAVFIFRKPISDKLKSLRK